jgi:hypothetical protein
MHTSFVTRSDGVPITGFQIPGNVFSVFSRLESVTTELLDA